MPPGKIEFFILIISRSHIHVLVKYIIMQLYLYKLRAALITCAKMRDSGRSREDSCAYVL